MYLGTCMRIYYTIFPIIKYQFTNIKIYNFQEKEKNGGTSQNSRYELPALQNVEASQTSVCMGHQSNNHLDTIAARSVLEMGYSEEKVLQAIHKITPSYSGMYSMSIFDEHMIIM